MLRVSPDLRLLEFEQGTRHLALLGDRAIAEFLIEHGNECGCLVGILGRLDDWRALTSEAVALAAGDRFPPRLCVVPR
jgi:hypothetical protein